ncbi:hypothetical protein GGI25_001999 [Coemansia spiralis]|uniref:Thioesterase domain-containing protein n=2 Tax=Coemansia TaxID=4863 RepID=A0A9W8KZQ9_9FUNG|nr:HotDog domain-containing protein [Coemansia spiralis]KAJ1992666.1 hypothetical protein EDC05_002609 [Coemansia umbellata]KAJ2623255.1 hypothetical protein GGI26_002482 [Coemansia sp. RSA 1358]KAJ2678807.1 hypothetical protein GGI25_001999 [Coemansia spiralis]
MTALSPTIDELTQRADACQRELLSAQVKLTTPPVSRLKLQHIEPTIKGDRVASACVTFSFTVDPTDCNTWGTIHGGCVFTVFNAAGKIAAAVVANGARGLVSTDLTTNYLAGVPAGSTVTVEMDCLRATRSIAFLRGSIRDASGALCYICVQNVGFEL